jgi:hypothetical protein
MSFAESIKKARESGMADDQILSAIIKQNPHKEDFFNKEKERGLTSTQILNDIISESEPVKEKPPVPSLPEIPVSPEIKETIPEKPTEETKLWMRIFITLILLSIAATSVTIFYRAFFVPKLKPINPEILIQEIQIPRATPPLVKLYTDKDSIERFAYTVDEEYILTLKKLVRDNKSGELLRLIVDNQKDGAKNIRTSTLEDFFNVFEIEFPESFFTKIEKEFNLFIYTKESPGKIAFAVRFDKAVRDDVEWTIMRPWEEKIAEDFRFFFAEWDQQISSVGEFSTTNHKGDMPTSFAIRYKEGSAGTGIYYTITEDRLLFATSLESIKNIIERYYYLTR